MRKAQGYVDLLALDLRAIADAVDLKHATKTLADTLGHIGDQFSRQPMQGPKLALFAFSLDSNDRTFNFYVDAWRNSRFELSLRSFQTHFLGFNGHLDSTRDRNGQLSNTGHSTPSFKLPYRTDELSTDICSLRFPLHHYCSGRREIVDSQSVSDRRYGLRAHIDPSARLADALDTDDHLTIFSVEVELNHKLLPGVLSSLYLSRFL